MVVISLNDTVLIHTLKKKKKKNNKQDIKSFMFWTIEMFLNFLIAQMKIKQIEKDKLKKIP